MKDKHIFTIDEKNIYLFGGIVEIILVGIPLIGTNIVLAGISIIVGIIQIWIWAKNRKS